VGHAARDRSGLTAEAVLAKLQAQRLCCYMMHLNKNYTGHMIEQFNRIAGPSTGHTAVQGALPASLAPSSNLTHSKMLA
jgi:hypothetical protein